MAAKGIVEEAPSPLNPGFYSTIFAVPKSSGGHRLVINLKVLNQHLRTPSFSMETTSSVIACLQGSRWAATIDLQDAYNHILIHPRARPFLRFAHHNKLWQFRALPFGLSTAPFPFTWVMRTVVKELRGKGTRVNAYLDDWIFHGPDRSLLLAQVRSFLDLAASLGLQVNRAKSKLTPSQRLEYLGMQIDLVEQRIYPTPKKCSEIQDLLRGILTSQNSQKASHWAHVIGVLMSQTGFVPRGRLHIRPLQSNLSQHWDYDWKHNSQCLVPCPSHLREHLLWWIDPVNLHKGQVMELLPPEATLFTDASQEGWGAHFLHHSARGQWSPVHLSQHINVLEMRAVLEAIYAFQSHIQDKSIVLASDNSTVLAYLRKEGGTHSVTLTKLAGQVLSTLDDWGTQLTLRHVPGRKNILADQLSRAGQILPSEWTLSELALQWIWSHLQTQLNLPPPQLDAFATSLNTRMARYWSPVPDPAALAQDALAQDWTQEPLYRFPPFPLLLRVLRRSLYQRHNLIVLIVPWNTGAVWFPYLLQVLDAKGLLVEALPAWPHLISQPLAEVEAEAGSTLSLHVCVLSAVP